jgi:hypothetical protein
LAPIEVINVDNQRQEIKQANAARGNAFECYVLKILTKVYPFYTWYHQGQHRRNERGLDFIGNRIGDHRGEPRQIGVQVKFHDQNNAPTEIEWLKFLSGCFSRRVDRAIFITSGKLTSEQRREADEANVIVIQGREEITRIAEQNQLEPLIPLQI